jgi:hypothetical protein
MGQDKWSLDKSYIGSWLMERRTLRENDSVQDTIRFEYEQALQTIRMLADIRFKLLALVPFISGATIAFLSFDPGNAPPHVILAGSFAGFLITVGVLIYNQRNTQFINVTRARCLELEKLLDLPVKGQFHSHQKTFRLFQAIPLWADLGLAIIYSTVLAAWLFLIMHTALDPFFQWPVAIVTIPITLLAAARLCFEIVRLDKVSQEHAAQDVTEERGGS